MSKPLIYKSWKGDLWYCSNYLYCGKGDTPKAAYDEWVKKRDQYTQDTLISLKRVWEGSGLPMDDKDPITIPFTQETIYPPRHKPLLGEYQGNPKDDYSDLVWYKRWWKRFADIWKGD